MALNALAPLYSREEAGCSSSSPVKKQWMTSDRRRVKPQRKIEDAVRISNTGNEDITVHDEDHEQIFADYDKTTT